ncbi:mediator complex subunit [Apophysomyces ossiformis]|uniref:Mediator complex subunit n=1 Tax=Apophysomyces ossiformis TaxID=679940 RepID=A0A8H7BLD6_9FUNG|nr:mediator complex subunit [Apophysomyces ossiformis]
MVEITPTKRRRIESSPESIACYPLSFVFSSLTYRQAPDCLSTSSQSVVVTVPPKPNPPAIDTITGDLYTNDMRKFLFRKTPVHLAEQYHKQHTITHLKWNHRGTALLSADETGKIAIWSLDGSFDSWCLTFEVDLQQPLAALLWLNADRYYAARDTTTFERQKVLGPRNPYGYMAFVAITVHGEINVQYQRNGPIFSSVRTTLPKSARDTSRADVGCFGMALAGLDDWGRISHAAATFGEDFDPASIITQLLLVEKKGAIQLIVGFGVSKDSSYASFVGRWVLQEVSREVPIKGMTEEYIRDHRWALKYRSGFSISNRFITSLTCARNGEALALGLSDGSIHMQYRESGDPFRLWKSRMLEGSISPDFWQATEPRVIKDGQADPVAGLTFSPNETHIVYVHSSSQFGTIRVTDNEPTQDTFEILQRFFKLGLLNNTDSLDIISELVRFGRTPEYKEMPEQVINAALAAYEIYCGQGDANLFQAKPDVHQIQASPDDWNLAQLGQAYGLALGTYKRLPNKRVQYINLTKAIQLPVILECFLGSCTSDYSYIAEVLESKTLDIKQSLEFEPEYADISGRPVHAVLLVHKPSRLALQKILIMIQQFVQFISSSSYELVHLPESRPLLVRCALTLLQNEPVALEDVLAFFFALDELAKTMDIADQWSLLLSSKLPQNVITPAQAISAKYKDKCAQPAIYLEQQKEQVVDVICKRRIQSNQKVRCCVRCCQPSLPIPEASDPGTFASWYRSIGRRCICGGLFT